jgi:hypothetical protein
LKRTTSDPDSIRARYETYGAEGYYREHGGQYANPHYPEVAALLARNIHRIDGGGEILDFSAGGGEVTLALRGLGVEAISGCDPFTFALYTQQTGRPCLPLSFKDVIREGLPSAYSAIIASFALHLCPEKDLFSLCWRLLEAAPQLVVLTPHKRPELEKLPGLQVLWEDFVLTDRGKKVRAKGISMGL